ncbi:tripartite tricarboxylate transporter TctB family protein [Clostridium sp. AM58-1XD]|uniref:tripartite tricarboxylate transporter TctB family protein n=1 Tax=Clostridium sp. AM58-1XD TaxID=2292307 RepID=UPI0015F5E45D|nr:tripartite tricarboxylate transporter TctB family protein [Clostridium sp. AM58-1XD]
MNVLQLKKCTTDLIVSLVIYCFLGAFAFQLFQMPDTAAWYPRCLLWGSVFLNTVVFIQNVKNSRKCSEYCDSRAFCSLLLHSSLYILLCGAYIFLIPITGYLLTTLLFLIIMLFTAGFRSVKILLIFPALMTASVYALFTYVLVVFLPAGSIFR